MSHLSIEPRDPSRQGGDEKSFGDHISSHRLAALADETPTAVEKTHLDACTHCRQEVEAHRALLVMAASERQLMEIPLTRWDSLSQRLREEQLIADAPAPGSVTAEWAAPIGTRRLSTRALLRVAAALMLVASGTVIGRASAGAPVLPGGLTGQDQPVAARPFSPAAIPTTFASLQEAEQYKEAAAGAYQQAIAFLAQHDSLSRIAETPAVMRTRLSALDRVSRTMREALHDAPYDPVINAFYLNSFGQREATLRALNASLPQGSRMNGF